MKLRRLCLAVLACTALWPAAHASGSTDILVTLPDDGARAPLRAQAPYQFRKQYSISPDTRRKADAIAREFSLQRLDDWPIDSLSVYCIVFRVSAGRDVQALIGELQADKRIASAQLMNEFSSSTSSIAYDDTFAGLQHALPALGIPSAHVYTQGAGARIAVIDSSADTMHEDLLGQIRRVQRFVSDGDASDAHGTAIVSVIAARSNNALGIVGVAPAADVDLYVACWRDGASARSVCNTFTLAKAIDAVISDGTDVLNMSLRGPYDPLIDALLKRAIAAGTIVVAATAPDASDANQFPANADYAIGVTVSQVDALREVALHEERAMPVFAPGRQVMVAAPGDAYELQSGTSIAAAHISGAIALLRASLPEIDADDVRDALLQSQIPASSGVVSVDACVALSLVRKSVECAADGSGVVASK